MPRMKTCSVTVHTLRWYLFAGSALSYFHELDPRMCLLFCTRKATNSFNFSLLSIFEQASSRTS